MRAKKGEEHMMDVIVGNLVREGINKHRARELAEHFIKHMAQPEQEPVALPCCGYTDASAVKWNPYNQVVQCHNCGQVYTTPQQRTWVRLTWSDVPDDKVNNKDFMEGAKWAQNKLQEINK